MNKKRKYPAWRLLLWWQKYVKWQHTKQTSAEPFRQTHRYVTLRQRLRTLLRTLRLQLKTSSTNHIWLLLRRARVRKRQWKTYHDGTDDNSAQHLNQDANSDSRSTSLEGPSPMIQYDGITIRDISNTSAHSVEAQFAALPSVDVSVDIVTDNKFTTSIKILFLGVLLICSFYTNQTVSSFLITYILCGTIRILNSAGFIQRMIQSLLASLQTGGVRKLKMFP